MLQVVRILPGQQPNLVWASQVVLREAENAGLMLDNDARSSSSDITSPTATSAVRLYLLLLPL